METNAISTVVDLDPFHHTAPVFSRFLNQVARRAPHLLARRSVMHAFLVIYMVRVNAFMRNDVDVLPCNNPTPMTVRTCLEYARHLAYHSPRGGKLVLKRVWPHVQRAFRHLLGLEKNARIIFEEHLFEDHADSEDAYEFAVQVARLVQVLNRRAS